MVDISVNYMGLELKSPFIAASSGYTADLEKIVALARCGAGAVVLKSLFEEQISIDTGFLQTAATEHTETFDYLHRYVADHAVEEYLELIKEAKRRSGIPVIASINCYSNSSWVNFAGEIERAGADALELNIYTMPLNVGKTGLELEGEYLKTVKQVAGNLRIPVAVKIGENYTSLNNFVHALQGYGAKGVVLFNRFYSPDISLKSLKIVPANPFSTKNEYLKELRWIAILSSQLRNFSLSASTGVYDPSSGIKLLLAGAGTVQLCSVLYKQGPFVLQDFNAALKEFMKSKGFRRIADFCGMLNYSNICNPAEYERGQFLKTAQHYSKGIK